MEPPVGVDGKRDFRQLIDLLEQPVHNAHNPPRKPVWHCSIRTDPTDRWLTDEQWAHIGGEVMAAVGLAPHADPKAVRWVAIRHGPDHIHIVATLVRQDRRTAWGRNDYWLAQAACRDLERRYGLRRLGPADQTGQRWPKAAELNKGRRAGRRETSRDRLRREVRFAAATAGGEGEFFALLHQAGLMVRARASSVHPEQITGYAVALPDDTTAAGEPVWYSGGKLATDLTLPQLRSRWGQPAAAADSATRVQRRKPGVVPVANPDDPTAILPPRAGFTAADLVDAIQHAATVTSFHTAAHPARPEGWPIRWGVQLDTRIITMTGAGEVTDQAVAGYLAKYATKSTEVTGHTSGRITDQTSTCTATRTATTPND